jgi:hypothetical protein
MSTDKSLCFLGFSGKHKEVVCQDAGDLQREVSKWPQGTAMPPQTVWYEGWTPTPKMQQIFKLI